jgi:inner membrane protein
MPKRCRRPIEEALSLKSPASLKRQEPTRRHPNVFYVWLALGVSDLRAISETAPLQWAGDIASAYKPGTNAREILGPGFHINVPVTEKSAGKKLDFSLQLMVRGSEGIAFTPVGERTAINVAGTWASPSFQGSLLPLERTISPDGFSARWSISNLTRTYPQIGNLDDEFYHSSYRDGKSITAFTAGVDLHDGVTLYRMASRAIKYGILFIAVSFVALFAFEMLIRQRMHLLQYGMVGLSMSLFYLILLSLAEHVNFGLSFFVATIVTAAMNGLYVASALSSKIRGLIMGALLLCLYGLLFSLLRMEDFSLAVGTGLVVVLMGVLMFVTRKLPQSTT